MKKLLSSIILIFFAQAGFTQELIAEPLIYPLQREVNNKYNAAFTEKIYRKSVSEFESFKRVAIAKMLEGVSAEKQEDPDYLKAIDSQFANPSDVNRITWFFNLPLYIDGVPVAGYDTTANHALYLNTCVNELQGIAEKTVFSWTPGDFKTIPTSFFGKRDRVDENLLTDGRYVMYYAPIFEDATGSFIKNRPYGYFTIKDKKLDGPAVFFSPKGDTIASGAYSQGQQTGLWKLKLPYVNSGWMPGIRFDQVTVEGEPVFQSGGWCAYEIEYMDSRMNGSFLFVQDGTIRSSGTMKNNKPLGKWMLYHENGRIANSFELIEEPYKLKKRKIYPAVYNKISSGMQRAPVMPFGNVDVTIPGFFEEMNGSVTIYEPDYENTGNDKLSITGSYEAYYANGSLFLKMEINNRGEVVGFSDKIVDEAGILIQQWRFNKKRTKGILRVYESGNRHLYKIKGKVYTEP